jgi:hypothetical protein
VQVISAPEGTQPCQASIYRALAEHDKAQAYPEAAQQAHADYAALHPTQIPSPAGITRPGQPLAIARLGSGTARS